MAHHTGKFINGAVGPVIFYTMNGKQFVRAKPGRQPRRRKKSAKFIATTTAFGLIAICGSAMIGSLRNRLLFPFRRETYNAIRGWMRNQYDYYHQAAEWKLTALGAAVCQVNPEASFTTHMRTPIAVRDAGNGKIVVAIDAMNPKSDLKAPAGTMEVNLKLVAVSMTFNRDNRETAVAEAQYLIDYTTRLLPSKELELNTGGQAGDIAIVVAALEYNTNESFVKGYNKALRNLPLAIIAMGRLEA